MEFYQVREVESMRDERVKRVLKELDGMGISQMLIVDPMSIYYLTGVYVAPFERFYGLYLRAYGIRIRMR